jgi:hypothetical protein
MSTANPLSESASLSSVVELPEGENWSILGNNQPLVELHSKFWGKGMGQSTSNLGKGKSKNKDDINEGDSENNDLDSAAGYVLNVENKAIRIKGKNILVRVSEFLLDCLHELDIILAG